jgi:hypothetical protein
MFMSAGIDQPKPCSQLRGKARRIVSFDGQATASFRAIDGEGPDDDVSARFERLSQPCDVCRPVIPVVKEMEGCPIVPDVIGLRWIPCGDVGNHPLHICVVAEASFRSSECRLRKIQDRYVIDAARDKAIHKTRRTASNIHDGGLCRGLRQIDQFKRWRRIFLKPADFILAFGGVDIFPMGSATHIVHEQPFRLKETTRYVLPPPWA